MGHIELAAPVSHIWYFKGIPSRMGLILDISPRILEKVLYFANYIVIDPGDTPLMKKQILTETEYRDMREKYEDDFRAGMGAEAIKELLAELDLDELVQGADRRSCARPPARSALRIIKRLEVVESFRLSRQPPGVDDHGRCPGHPAGDPPDGTAGRRPLRDLRPERSVPPRHQPQQPSQAPARAGRAGHHRPQREAHAAGGC